MIKIEEKNIVVREFNQADYNSFLVQLVANKGWTDNFAQWRVRKEEAPRLFAYHLEGYKEDADIKENRFMYGIFTKQGLLIGECGFEYNKELGGVEVFLGLIEQARGKGYSNEIMSALKKAASELGIKKVNANIPTQHLIGVKMLEKAQFKMVNTFDVEFQGNVIEMAHYVYAN